VVLESDAATDGASDAGRVRILYYLRVFDEAGCRLALKMLHVVCMPHHEVYVHVDKKSEWSPEHFKEELAKVCVFSRVHVSKKHDIGWGKVNEVYPFMDCIHKVNSLLPPTLLSPLPSPPLSSPSHQHPLLLSPLPPPSP
jgi:hypothetical protein